MSSIGRKTLRNTALLVAFEVANPLLSLLLIGTLSRKLGADGLGAYNLVLSFFFVAHSFTSLGLNTLITRDVSREPKSATRYLCSSSVPGVLVALTGAAGLFLTLRVAGYGGVVERSSWLVGLSLLPSIVILYSESIFIAHEKVQFIVYLAMLENAGRVLVGLWLLRSGFGVFSLIVSFAALRYVTLVLNLTVFHRQIAPLNWSFDPNVAWDMIRNVPIFGTILIVATLYQRSDIFILSKMATLAAVGYYTAGYRLFAISQVLPKSFNTTLFPVLTGLFPRSRESFLKTNSLSIRYLLVALLPIAAGIHGLAEPVVRVLFGKGFGSAVPILKVVIWTLVPYGVTKVLASSLFASNRQVIDLKVNVVGLVANLGLNLILIPRYGALGCAWATLISMCVFLACQCFFLRREILPVLRGAEVIRPTLAAAAMLLWLWLTPGLPLPVRVTVGAAIYGLLLILLQVVNRKELALVLPESLAAVFPGEREP